MPFTKEYWAKRRTDAAAKGISASGNILGRRGYPAEVKDKQMSPEEYKRRLTHEQEISRQGRSAIKMIAKAIKEGLADDGNYNIKTGTYDLSKQVLGLNAAKYVVDKLVADKIVAKKEAGVSSVDDIRKSLFGLLKGLKGRGKKSAGLFVQTDGTGIEGDIEHRRPEDAPGVTDIIGSIRRLEGEKTNRLLRAGGSSTGQLSPELEGNPGSTGGK